MSLLPPVAIKRELWNLKPEYPAAIRDRNQTLLLSADLTTPQLDNVRESLWLAGLPRPARPLRHQKLLNDLEITKEIRIVLKEIAWTAFVKDFLAKINPATLEDVNKRYQYGELRLSRLNNYFSRNFAWLLVLFAYISIVI
ncbi:hypothetical protein BDY21DRAFT_422379 [Lineolata rhizophorae]|uniref:Uncharacterized protein n=1 Tax=Lineolata rhizophorae TaxID=578093 RepID=A0A6A6NYM6_9PEZI|nr:hypothetical protein BDY21DRAFT_422379 [Lineolata rhizophorae]